MITLFALIFLLVLIGGSLWGWPLLAGILGISGVSDKAGALQHIRQLMLTYDISPVEVEAVSDNSSYADTEHARRSKGDIAKTLFIYLGAIFIVAGISTYIGMFWDSMGSTLRIFLTLGVGYILFIVLVSALYEQKYPRLILPLALASVFMMAGGWYVFIDELFPQRDDLRTASLFVFAAVALHFGTVFSKYQRPVLAFTTLFFTYGFMQIGLDILGVSFAYIAIILGASLFMVGNALSNTPQRVLAEAALLFGAGWLNSGLFDLVAMATGASWASLMVGVCVMLTAYGLHSSDRYPRLTGLGYLLGSIMFYGGLFDLVQNTSIELIYLAATASLLYACVVLQSRALLLTTVLAMLSYIGYFSAKHFADSLGWPITLVLMGVAFLAVGSLALRLKRQI